MKIERERPGAGPIVTGFSNGGFRVGEEVHRSLLLTTERATAWTPPPLAELTLAAIGALIEPAPEFVLLGTGPTLIHPARAFARTLEAANIGLEVMDSRAAARAWGVLRGEGRQIAAALYPL